MKLPLTTGNSGSLSGVPRAGVFAFVIVGLHFGTNVLIRQMQLTDVQSNKPPHGQQSYTSEELGRKILNAEKRLSTLESAQRSEVIRIPQFLTKKECNEILDIVGHTFR